MKVKFKKRNVTSIYMQGIPFYLCSYGAAMWRQLFHLDCHFTEILHLPHSIKAAIFTKKKQSPLDNHLPHDQKTTHF